MVRNGAWLLGESTSGGNRSDVLNPENDHITIKTIKTRFLISNYLFSQIKC
uniref:Uncharacterized protein n=1 Tax=Anguilla anguilla TaxID=7936 RepID=A0A0E9TKC8_ANGAN